MKYDLDWLHRPKRIGYRGEGFSTEAMFKVIGSIMVTENTIIPIVVMYTNRHRYLSRIFFDIVINHFKLTPTLINDYCWGIKGYSSMAKVFTLKEWEEEQHRGRDIEPIYDLD